MSFLTGLGAVAGGFDQTLGPLLQQYQQNVATGQGIASMYGGLPQQGGSSPLQGLSGVPNVPVSQPSSLPQVPGGYSPISTGGASPSPVAVPQVQTSQAAPPPLASSSPRNNPSVGQSPVSQQPPAQVPSTQAPSTAQQSPTVQQQQNQPAKQPDLTPYNGMFDFHQMIGNLLKTPGMNYEKLGRIANSRAFENMLNQQGLQQYRMLNLGDRSQRGWASIDERGRESDNRLDEARKREADIDRRQGVAESFRGNLAGSTLKVQDLFRQRSAINSAVVAGQMTPEDAQKKLAPIDDAIKTETDKIQSLKAPVAAPTEEGGDSAVIFHDPNSGKNYRYKGTGDRKDKSNWEPVSMGAQDQSSAAA